MKDLTSETMKLSREIVKALEGIKSKLEQIKKLPISVVDTGGEVWVVLSDEDILYLEKQTQWIRECWTEMKNNEKYSRL